MAHPGHSQAFDELKPGEGKERPEKMRAKGMAIDPKVSPFWSRAQVIRLYFWRGRLTSSELPLPSGKTLFRPQFSISLKASRLLESCNPALGILQIAKIEGFTRQVSTQAGIISPSLISVFLFIACIFALEPLDTEVAFFCDSFPPTIDIRV
jgi:hypothetical protein